MKKGGGGPLSISAATIIWVAVWHTKEIYMYVHTVRYTLLDTLTWFYRLYGIYHLEEHVIP